MKKSLWRFITISSIGAAMVFPVGSFAQNGQAQNKPKHHHYKLIDMGTLGGPQSYLNDGSSGFLEVPDVNHKGVLAGWADTSMPDPFPNFCFDEDCFVAHAFRWQDGVTTDLGVLPGGASSQVSWISGNGLIAGVSENGETDPLIPGLPEVRAVVWGNSGISDLGTLEGGHESFAEAINNPGQVVGFFVNAIPDQYSMWGLGYQARPFLWQNGVMQDLGTLGTGTDAQALLINQQGQVVGWSYTSSSPGACSGIGLALTTDSFIWDKEKGMVDLGSLGGTCTIAADLNNRGQVVGTSFLTGDQGQRAFLWEKGSLHDLGGSFGADFTGASALNETGEAVGFGYFPDNTTYHAALWKRVGQMIDLGTAVSGDCSFASSINAKTQVVGEEGKCDGSTSAAFLWENDSIVDLNTLTLPGSSLDLTYTFTINDRGEIAGKGLDGSGNEHALLLIPCDENHPEIESCDYDSVETMTETNARRAPASLAPKASSAKGSQAEIMTLFQSSRAGRNRHIGPLQHPPK